MPEDRREADRQWREQMLVQLTKLGSNDEHLERALKDFARFAEERMNRTDHQVNKIEGLLLGDGMTPGVFEKIRTINTKMTVAVTIIVFLVTQLSNYIFKRVFEPEIDKPAVVGKKARK